MADEEKTVEEVFGAGNPDEGTPPEEPNQEPDDGVTIAGGEVEGKPTEELSGEQVPKSEFDQMEKSKKFFERTHQETMELLNQNDPFLYDQIKGQLQAKRKEVQQPPEPEPEPDVLGVEGDDYIAEIRKAVREEVSQAQVQLQAQERYSNEYHIANKAVIEFEKANGITPEQSANAWKAIKELNVDIKKIGGPTTVAKLLLKEYQLMGLQGHFKEKVTQAQVEAEKKVAEANSVTQPTAGALPEPGEKSKEEKLLESMRAVGGSAANEEVFG